MRVERCVCVPNGMNDTKSRGKLATTRNTLRIFHVQCDTLRETPTISHDSRHATLIFIGNFITLVMQCLFSSGLSPTQQVRRSPGMEQIPTVELARACPPCWRRRVVRGPLFGAMYRVIYGDVGVLAFGTASHKRDV